MEAFWVIVLFTAAIHYLRSDIYALEEEFYRNSDHLSAAGPRPRPTSTQKFRCMRNTTNIFHCSFKSTSNRMYGKSVFAQLASILIATSNDVQLNPGPAQVCVSNFPCGSCKDPVTWDHKGIMCENCNTWFHINCQNINESTYEYLGSCDVSWYCFSCNTPNYSMSLFDLHDLEFTNPFQPLQDDVGSSYSQAELQEDPESHPIPIHTSSPTKSTHKGRKKTPLRIINVNCQSIKNKHGEFLNMIDSTKPDIIIGTESCVNPDIKDNEYFPDTYSVHRNDRPVGQTGGGVFVAVRRDYISSSVPDLDTDCEIKWVKIEIVGCKTLHICSYYSPHYMMRKVSIS